MKKLLLFFVLILAHSQVFALDYYIDLIQYYNPDQGYYMETHINIPGNEINVQKSADNNFYASVEVLITFKDFQKIVSFDKYSLSSVPLKTETEIFSLVDVKRFALPPGNYTCEIEFTDLLAPANKELFTKEVTILDQKLPYFSDILLLESYNKTEKSTSFSKNGYELLPYLVPYFPNDFTSVKFYTELYHTDSLAPNSEILLTYAIMDETKTNVINNLRGAKKAKTQPIVVLLTEISLESLQSGNYLLVCEARDKSNKLITEKVVKLHRNNSLTAQSIENIHLVNYGGTFVEKLTDEEVLFYLQSLTVRADANEKLYIENLYARKDAELARKFLFNYWVGVDGSMPQDRFMAYKSDVDYAEKNYATQIRKGFQTDRGRIRIKYGEPNEKNVFHNETGSFPHEVWKYFAIDGLQTNVSFVFMNQDLITNDFRLIHSNLRGEVSDPNWQRTVYGTVPSNNTNDFDLSKPADYYGKNPH